MSKYLVAVPHVWTTIGSTFGVRSYAVLVQLSIVALTANAFGPSGRGTIAAIVSWTLFFATFGALSLGQATTILPTQNQSQVWLGPTLATLFAVTAASTTICWALIAVAWLLRGANPLGNLDALTVAVGLSALPFVIWQQFQLYLLIAIGQLDRANRAHFIGRTISLVGVAISTFFFSTEVVLSLGAITAGEACIAAIGLRLLIQRASNTLRFSWLEARSLLRRGLLLHPNAVGAFLMSSTQILVLHKYYGSTETGYFQLATFATDAIALGSGSATLVIFEQSAAKGLNGGWREYLIILRNMMILTIVGALLVAMFAPIFFPLLFGESFERSVPLLWMLLPTLVGRSLQNLLAPQWIGRGLLTQFSAGNISLGIANVILCLALIPSLGATGAAIASNITYALTGIFNLAFLYWIARKQRASGAENEHLPAKQN